MPILRTTWTITHERPLEPDEDPLAALHAIDPDVILWAVEEGRVTTSVEIFETAPTPSPSSHRAGCFTTVRSARGLRTGEGIRVRPNRSLDTPRHAAQVAAVRRPADGGRVPPAVR